MKKEIKKSKTGWVFNISNQKGIKLWYYFNDPTHNNEHVINFMVENDCFKIPRQFVSKDGRLFNVIEKDEEKYNLVKRTMDYDTKLKDLSTFFLRRDILIHYRSLVNEGISTVKKAKALFLEELNELGLNGIYKNIQEDKDWNCIRTHHLI